MQLKEVIREISGDLNDQVPGHEFTRWTVAQLQSYVREALITVGQQLKDLFTDVIIVKVRPGAGWQEACDCTHISRILGETDAEGNILRFLNRSVDIENNTWTGPVVRCPMVIKTYEITGYSVSNIKLNQFRIVPPMPPGVTKYVLVECYRKPDSLDLTENVPDEVVAMVKQWALYRALAVDSENNPTIIQLAQAHNKTFSELLGLAIAERERRNEDNPRAVQNPPTKRLS